jgi:phosphatidylinositol alpha-mannosyltransferase
MMSRGHDVTVITGRPGSWQEAASDFRCVRLGRNVPVPMLGGISDLAVGRGLRASLRRILTPEHFDVLHVHSPLVPTLPLIATEVSQVPVVGHFHSYARRHWALALTRGYLRPRYESLALRLAVSPAALEFLSKYFDASGVRVVPSGVDLTRFHPEVPPYARLRDDKLNLLFVGRLEPRKGLHVLIAALRKLRLKDRARLLVVGDGPLREPLTALAATARCEVLFLRSVTPDLLPRVYASADVFCAPATENESFGIVLLEALATGLPVLATDLPGYRFVVRHGTDGVLVTRPDPAAWAEALEWLLEDGEAREAFRRRARLRAEPFSWPSIVDRLELEYCRAAGLPAPDASRRAPVTSRARD